MKKIIAAITLLTLVATLFTGCGFTCSACGEKSSGEKHELLGQEICDDCWNEAFGAFG